MPISLATERYVPASAFVEPTAVAKIKLKQLGIAGDYVLSCIKNTIDDKSTGMVEVRTIT